MNCGRNIDREGVVKVWNENLKRWAGKSGLGEEGIVLKTTRKSIESWIVCSWITYEFHLSQAGA